MLDAETLRKLLSYNGDTGHFSWIKKRNGIKPGRPAGYIGTDGYVSIRINGKLYKAHRLAWLHHYGTWPTNLIDHINGNTTDNRIVNLREATHSQNLSNVPAWGTNTSGFKGVSWCRKRGRWKAQIRFQNKRKTIGLFETKQEAFASYCAAGRSLHGPFFNPGTEVSADQDHHETERQRAARD
jgi:hypothetical protein